MINFIFYIVSILFIWNEIYYLKNKKKLDIKIKNRDIGKFGYLDYLYYLSRIFYWIWLIIGCFTINSFYFLLIILLGLVNIVFYVLFKKQHFILDKILSIVSILIIILILVKKFTNYLPLLL